MDRIAGAIADPVRREILELLRGRPRPAGDIAGAFDISRPAVSRHLRVLREAGLVVDTVDGRRRIYRLAVEPLIELNAWVASFFDEEAMPAAGAASAGWGARFDALATEVHRTRRDRRRTSDTADRQSSASRPTHNPEEQSA